LSQVLGKQFRWPFIFKIISIIVSNTPDKRIPLFSIFCWQIFTLSIANMFSCMLSCLPGKFIIFFMKLYKNGEQIMRFALLINHIPFPFLFFLKTKNQIQLNIQYWKTSWNTGEDHFGILHIEKYHLLKT